MSEDLDRYMHGEDLRAKARLGYVVTKPQEQKPAPQPAPGWDDATGYAERLAVSLWEKHYKTDADQWKPLSGDLIGILTQIDNMTTGLSRSSQSTSDAGGGVRELKPCPFCGGEPDISTRMDEDLWTHNIVEWTKVSCDECSIYFEWPPGAKPDAKQQWNTRAALSNPAAADSNASAEARLREYDPGFVECVATGRSCVHEAIGPNREQQCIYCGSPMYPHASDGRLPGPNYQETDETKARLAEIVSDRPADVTEDDLVRVIKTVNVDFGGWETDLARAIIEAFTVGRR